MKSPVIKRSIVIAGHKTSVSLEDAFWKGLKEIADDRDVTLSDLVSSHRHRSPARQSVVGDPAVRARPLSQSHHAGSGARGDARPDRDAGGDVSSARRVEFLPVAASSEHAATARYPGRSGLIRAERSRSRQRPAEPKSSLRRRLHSSPGADVPLPPRSFHRRRVGPPALDSAGRAAGALQNIKGIADVAVAVPGHGFSLAKVTLDRSQKLSSEGLRPSRSSTPRRPIWTPRTRSGACSASRSPRPSSARPSSGTLGLRRVSEGAWVSPSTVLATLQDTSTLKLDFTLPERYAGCVALGSEFRFKVDGQRREPSRARCSRRSPSVDKQRAACLVRGVVEQQPSLLPGTFATVEVPLRIEQALLVPAIAVVPDVEGRRVFVVEDGVARSACRSRSAPAPRDRVQILSGLKPGDQVVVSNLLRVRNGAKVKLLSARAADDPRRGQHPAAGAGGRDVGRDRAVRRWSASSSWACASIRRSIRRSSP